MKYLVTSREMKQYDANTIDKIGIPGMVLMERAALSVSAQIEKRFGSCSGNTGCVSEADKVLVVAGVGNNGGDGLALARLLAEMGYEVDVCCVGDSNKASEQWRIQREILAHYPASISVWETGRKMPENEYTIVVDAIFGIGLSREVMGVYADVVAELNHMKGFKIALDVPSGLDADTGKVLGCAVRANLTVTFGFCKRGLVLYPGCEYAGEIVTADIGISKQSFLGEEPGMFCLEETQETVHHLLPERARAGNKGTFGKVLLVAGSMNMAGAAILSARAAYRAGAGMVKVITPEENRVIVQTTLPEALLGTAEELKESLKWADVIAIGPGLGKSEQALACLQSVICDSNLPLLIDADGLNILAEKVSFQEILASQDRDMILTPHVGELSKLTGESVPALKEHLADAGMALAEKLNVTVVAKDARTFVCETGRPVCVNLKGNSGMATAGSGDVLAGIIAGLLAQGTEAFEAACNAVCLHALAGDAAAEQYGEHALMAGDLVDKVEDLGEDTERRSYSL